VAPGFLRCDDGLVKATKLNKGLRHPSKRYVQRWVYRAHADGTFKVLTASSGSPAIL
jgi:hypothetical protein